MKAVRTNYGRREKSDLKMAVLLISPVAVYLIAVMVFPIIWALYLTFTSSAGTGSVFAGFKNYLEILKDKDFYQSLWATGVFTFFSVAGKVVLGIAWAVILNQPIRFRNVNRALLILPWALPTVISILTWKWLFADAGGVLSYLCRAASLTDKNVLWLSSGSLAMVSVVIVNIWRGIPFIGISVLSGLQTVSKDLYEAATIDGANAVKRFIYVTIPQVKNVILLASLVTTIWTINDFEIVWLLTRGGPAFKTEIISVYSYRVGFLNLDVPKAMAVSFLFLPFLLILVNLATKRTLAEDN